MADDEKPFTSPFDRLMALRDRLPRSRPKVTEPVAPAPPEESAPPDAPETDPEADFSEAMTELGVDAIESGTDRLVAKPQTPSEGQGPIRKQPGRVHSGERGPEDGFDASTPRLDLHGMSIENALAEVARRVAEWRRAGVTKARIVTGRGKHSGDGHAAIREAVEAWLRRAPGAVGVYRARAGAGGDGVLLFEQLGKGRKR